MSSGIPINLLIFHIFQELRSIRNLLSRRGLYTETIRKVCNGCGKLGGSLLGLFALLLVVRFAWGRGQ